MSSANVFIREVADVDAESFHGLQRRLDEETTMMMLEPGERCQDVDAVRSHLQETRVSPNSTIIVAESDDQIVGYVEAEGGGYRRTRHGAYVVTGVLREYQGRGIGRRLLGALRGWAIDHGVARLELTVRADNDRARRLYAGVGFAVEGVRRGSLRVDGEMIDELAMALLVPSGHEAARRAGALEVRPLQRGERPWLEQQLIQLWGSTQIVTRGRVHDASTLRALVCHAGEEPVGLATIDIRDRQCEVVTLNAFNQSQGIGSALLAAISEEAKRQACHRVWLITTNDNLRALRFYQRRGLRLAALHPGAVDEARSIKPGIPPIGEHDIPIHDELELELRLGRPKPG